MFSSLGASIENVEKNREILRKQTQRYFKCAEVLKSKGYKISGVNIFPPKPESKPIESKPVESKADPIKQFSLFSYLPKFGAGRNKNKKDDSDSQMNATIVATHIASEGASENASEKQSIPPQLVVR
jgi:hypothetical protein